MKPKLLLNLILLAVVAALVGVALLEPGKDEPKTVQLTDIDVEALDRFELKTEENLVFAKREGVWWLAEPFAAPANDVRVRQLLRIANVESRANYPLKVEELAKFDLDKPKAIMSLGGVKLVFGGFEPIDMMRYVQKGDTLHLVADDFAHHLTAKSTDYVNKKLLPEDAKLKTISIPGLKASLNEKGQWVMDPPGDLNAMAELQRAWETARAIEVKRHEQAAQGEPVGITLANGQTVDWVITRREPDLILVRPDWKLEYTLAGETAKGLLNLLKPGESADKAEDEDDSESPPSSTDAPENLNQQEDVEGENVDGE